MKQTEEGVNVDFWKPIGKYEDMATGIMVKVFPPGFAENMLRTSIVKSTGTKRKRK